MSRKLRRGLSSVIVRTPSGREVMAEADDVVEAMETAQKMARMPAEKRRYDGHAISEGTREIDGASLVMMCGKQYRITETELHHAATAPGNFTRELHCSTCIGLELD